ncbi:MAG: ribosome recycling factor [Patescibacteria group bacterium]
MSYNFTPIKNQGKEIAENLKRELASIRTGRATPVLLDGIMVNVYASRLPLKNLAAVVIEDARTLRLNPWDKNQIKDIEAAIAAANLGVSITTDEAGFRIIFSELTAESRGKLVKVVKGKLEEARNALRQARDKAWSEIQKNEREKKISEDDKFRFKDELQKIIDQENKNFELLIEKKEKEILN